jgi:hypothetical protein
MELSALTFQRQFSRFEQRVRDHSDAAFISFRDGLPAKWEDYKQEVRKEALRRLQFDNWKQTQVGKGRILDRVIKAIEINEPRRRIRNNLVAWQNRYGHKNRSHRALLDARSNVPARRNLEQWFLDFFQGKVTEAEAFDRFLKLAGNRYDLVAYLFFLKDWKEFMPIAPTTFDKALRLLGVDLVTSGRASWQNYARYNETLLAVKEALTEVAGVSDARLIDAHSFCWMLVRLKLPASQPAPIIPLPKPLGGLEALGPKLGPVIPPTEFDAVDDDQFAQREAKRHQQGRLAQDIAFQSELRRLHEAGHPNPKDAVKKVWHEPRRGYDILSCELDGSPRYIEVKASQKSGTRFSFYLTPNEWKQSRALPNYRFYLVLNVQSTRPIVFVIDGKDLPSECLIPANYFASFCASRS